jgi:hypothetical protein
MRIRDTFDRFFSYLEQFERAIRNRVVDEQDVYPYFAYWFEMLGGERHLPQYVSDCVLEYIGNYGFPDVVRFLHRSWPKTGTRPAGDALPDASPRGPA